MCRVAAIIGEGANIGEKLVQMTNAMHRGGPDDEGLYVDANLYVGLAHRRLSIIDLSSGGHQPMSDHSANVIVSFNGEIYNFIELRNELKLLGHVFKSSSDTEVLIYAYIEWGIDFLNKLNGMFAFVLLDKRNGTVLVARDPIGIKPIYYGKNGGLLYFSSEVKGFLAVDSGWPQYKPWPIWFLTFGYLPEPFTTLENVWQLPKGSYLLYNLESNSYEINTYNIFSNEVEVFDTENAVELVRKALLKSVEKHLLSDVPIGVFLSGGVDSSLLTILAQKNIKEKLTTLSIYFEDEKYSEKRFQDIIISKTGVSHHSFKVSKLDFELAIEEILDAMDQPSIDGINTFFITKYAKQLGLKVVFSGLGADELFGGYNSFSKHTYFQNFLKAKFALKILGLFSKSYPLKKFEYLSKDRWYNEYLLNRGLFVPSDISKILNIDQKTINKELAKLPIPINLANCSHGNKNSMFELYFYMGNQLLKDSDIYSMWHSVELRVPFLDKDLIQLALSISPKVKYGNKQKKFLLIEAFKNDLPNEIWNRKKKGFTFPLETWFKQIPIFRNNWFLPKIWQKSFEKNQINYGRLWNIFILNAFGSLTRFNLNSKFQIPKTLFVYLSGFSNTGGIEKVNLSILKSISDKEFSENLPQAYGVYDNLIDTRYFPRFLFKGFNANRVKLVLSFIFTPIPWDHVIVGHVNLGLAIRILKIRKPSIKITLIAHGIEVWGVLKGNKKWILNNSDRILSVSNFTKNNLVNLNKIQANKIHIQPNCLDPYYVKTELKNKPSYLLKRYNIPIDKKIILTISRFSKTEKYKGYDKVLTVLAKLKNEFNNFLYILGGKGDMEETERIKKMIREFNLEENVLFLGYIPIDELADFYKLADIFVMPSKNEGFGIVFIEAAFNGNLVIGGNGDGSKEALMDGKIGKLVDPDDFQGLYELILMALKIETIDKGLIQNMVYEKYNFEFYKGSLLEKLNYSY